MTKKTAPPDPAAPSHGDRVVIKDAALVTEPVELHRNPGEIGVVIDHVQDLFRVWFRGHRIGWFRAGQFDIVDRFDRGRDPAHGDVSA